jgi:hypothetical protein
LGVQTLFGVKKLPRVTHSRSGKGSRSRIAIGAKVKLYRRETEDFWRYRFVGG